MRFFWLLLLVLAACSSSVAIPVETGPPIEVHFCERENCTALLTGLLDTARSAKCAFYDVSLPEVQASLARFGFVTEDGRGALMHNKFCVIDDRTVWTGSWNPTRGNKANNVVIISSKALAQNYLDEFGELPGGKSRVRYPKIVYNNNVIENYFCPEDGCKKHVMEELESARESIRFMLAYFTDMDIMRLLEQKSKNVIVQGIVDKSQKRVVEMLPFVTTGSIHHKVFIIDDKTVITGSYNPTKNGDKNNDENILIIHDPVVAGSFVEEFNQLATLSAGIS